jgi:hypothetical protein
LNKPINCDILFILIDYNRNWEVNCVVESNLISVSEIPPLQFPAERLSQKRPIAAIQEMAREPQK